jgi:hypothetical protein
MLAGLEPRPKSSLEPAFGTLALVRIATGVVLATSADVHGAAAWATLDVSLASPAAGVGWLGTWVPVNPALADAARMLAVAGATLGALGVYARPAFATTAVSLVYLLALPQRAGSVTHAHHLLWLAALLACSPCDRAMALGGCTLRCFPWQARIRSPAAVSAPRSVEDGAAPTATSTRSTAAEACAARLAVVAGRALVACVYFFPGFWKLWTSGVAWLAPATLRGHLHWKWMQAGRIPWPRIDEEPALLTVAAATVLLLETGMPLWVSWWRTRPLALMGAVMFHLGTARFLYIRFESLFPLLLFLVDTDLLRRWARRRPRPEGFPASPAARSQPSAPSSSPEPAWSSESGSRTTATRAPCLRKVGPTAVCAAALVGGAATAGALGAVQAWPFACYPTFDRPVSATMPALGVEVVDARGRARHLPYPRDNREWALSWRLVGAYGDRVSEARLRAYVRRLRARDPARLRGAVAVRLYAERLALDPAAPEVVRVARRRLLYEVALLPAGRLPAVGGSHAPARSDSPTDVAFGTAPAGSSTSSSPGSTPAGDASSASPAAASALPR